MKPTLPNRRAMARFMADLEISMQGAREEAASGWLIVTVDMQDDPPTVLNACGPYETPEAALIDSGRMDAEDKRLGEDGEGWAHAIVPMFSPPL